MFWDGDGNEFILDQHLIAYFIQMCFTIVSISRCCLYRWSTPLFQENHQPKMERWLLPVAMVMVCHGHVSFFFYQEQLMNIGSFSRGPHWLRDVWNTVPFHSWNVSMPQGTTAWWDLARGKRQVGPFDVLERGVTLESYPRHYSPISYLILSHVSPRDQS